PLLLLRGLPRRRGFTGSHPGVALRPLARGGRRRPRGASQSDNLHDPLPAQLQVGRGHGMPDSYIHGASSIPLLGETIGQNLCRTVGRFANAEALVVRHQNFRATYAELWDLTTRAAGGLLARGVRKGDRV